MFDCKPLMTAAQTRELERATIDNLNCTGYQLMCNAGAGAYATLKINWPDAERLTVLCGLGNNAGDGYVLGRLALQEGRAVQVLALERRLVGDAYLAQQAYCAAGGQIVENPSIEQVNAALQWGDVWVDALFGIGLTRPISQPFSDWIAALYLQPRKPVLALDVPSGLSADTGHHEGAVVSADVTITFLSYKVGLHTGRAADCCGTLVYASLGAKESWVDHVQPNFL